jgi:hypothetical protein
MFILYVICLIGLYKSHEHHEHEHDEHEHDGPHHRCQHDMRTTGVGSTNPIFVPDILMNTLGPEFEDPAILMRKRSVNEPQAPATIRIINDFTYLNVAGDGSNLDVGKTCSFAGMILYLIFIFYLSDISVSVDGILLIQLSVLCICLSYDDILLLSFIYFWNCL